MKRLILLLSLSILALTSSAQKYQDALLYGENKNRLDVFYMLGIPNDTFAIPSFPQDKRRKPHIAAKYNTIYLWDTIAYKWNPYAPGGGAGGGDGILNLGNSGNYCLTRVNDSTYAVDSACLANYFLRRKDSVTTTNPLGYVTKKVLADSAGKKADTSQLVKINTTYRPDSSIVYYDSTTGTYKHIPKSSLGSGGISYAGSGAFSVLKWRTGDENAPAAGDSLIIHHSFIGKYAEFYRGLTYGYFLEHVVSDTGFVRVNDTTYKVKPGFALNEWYYIRLTDSSALTQLTLQAPSTPPSTTIAYVNSADGGNNGGSTSSRTFSYTVGSASNTILLVGFVGDTYAGADDVSSVTYNGVTMTLVNKTYNSTSGGRWQYLYYLLNPASGAHNVVITCGSTHYIIAGAAEYSGVQSIESSTTNNTDLSTLTTTVTTVANNCWNVIFSGSPGAVSNASTGSTKRANSSIEYWTWFDSGGAITPAGSYSMTTTLTAGSKIGHCLAVLKPY